MTPLLPATPGITYTTVLLVAARCFIRLHFSLRGLPEDLRALSLTLASTALTMAQMCCPMVRCEACGAEEPLPHEDYPRAERIKVCGPYTGSVNMCQLPRMHLSVLPGCPLMMNINSSNLPGSF